MIKINPLSLSTTPIEILTASEKSIGKATGFFYSRSSTELFLVTNWHVVTGRDLEKPTISKNGEVPTIIRIFLHKRTDKSADVIETSKLIEIEFYINDEDGNSPEWFEHPTLKNTVDVVVFKIDGDLKERIQNECMIQTIMNDTGMDNRYHAEVMDHIYIIGYPWDLTGGNKVMPLYKNGSIASEPDIDYYGRPRMLGDSRTTKGMSGSPVVVVHNGYWRPNRESSDKAIFGKVTNFLGIYSGRLLSREKEDDSSEENQHKEKISEVGYIWKKRLIDEIIQGDTKGTAVKDF